MSHVIAVSVALQYKMAFLKINKHVIVFLSEKEKWEKFSLKLKQYDSKSVHCI